MSKINNKLKPCVIFDIDDTLLECPDIDWSNLYNAKGQLKVSVSNAIINAKPIKENVFLYNALDYMINDPIDGNPIDGAPKDIFFCTARPESLREDTVASLMGVINDAPSYISKRLIMRPEWEGSWSQYKAKEFCIEKVRDRGFYPALVFENNLEACIAYLEDPNTRSVHNTISTKKDKQRYVRKV